MSLKKNLLFRLVPFWERFNQSLSKYIPAEKKIKKNKNFEDFLLNTTQKYFQAEIWKTSLGNMEDKILGFQFKTVSAKPTRPSYKFQKLRHFVLKGKARLSWNTAALEFTEAVIRRYFSKKAFLKISQYSQKNTCIGVSF